MGVTAFVFTSIVKVAVLPAAPLKLIVALVISALAGTRVIPLKVTLTLLPLRLLNMNANSLKLDTARVENGFADV
jgi:hypothetical protein